MVGDVASSLARVLVNFSGVVLDSFVLAVGPY